MQGLLFDKSMVSVAVERIRTFEPEDGYWLAFSGGKDSVVTKALTDLAGVKYEAHYNVTGIDPPELVRFIRDVHPDVKRDVPPKSFWRLFQQNGFPTRKTRWCCAELKERGGKDRIVLSGVRWAESARRRNRHGLVTTWKNITLVNPIIDWEDADVWTFIRENSVRYCSLYDEGFQRLGCVLCPMARDTARQIERWPKIAASWRRAFQRFYDTCETLQRRSAREKKWRWSSAEALWRAWLDRDASLRGNLVMAKECELFAGAGIEIAKDCGVVDMEDPEL